MVSCERALQIFADMCSSICSGDITAEVLRKVQQNTAAFDAIAQLTLKSPQNIHSVLQQFQDKFESFEIQKRQLGAVCSMIPDEVQGKIINSVDTNWLYEISTSFCMTSVKYKVMAFHCHCFY